MVIYVDEMFLENFIMNYLIIYMTGYILKNKTIWYKRVLGAGVGAVYVIFSYILNVTIYQEFIYKFILSAFIILISFNIGGVKDFIKSFFVFYLITFMIGGVSFGFIYLLNIKINTYDGGVYIEKFPLQVIIISTFTVFICVKIIGIILKNKMRFNTTILPIEIFLNNKKIRVDALFDTGNTVRAPYTNKNVIFVEIESLKQLVPYTVYEVLKNCDEIDKLSDYYWKTRFTFIPFSTVGHDREMILGIKPDKVIVFMDERRIITNDVVIGVCKRKLSKGEKYSALLGNIITNDEEVI